LGKAHGEAEGQARGKAEGKAELLIRQATLKFGPLSPEARARIRVTASEELDQMAERLIGAATLDEVFAS
jgi:hypothetical protein